MQIKQKILPSTWIYPLFISLGSVAAILFTPAIPAIQKHFAVDSDSVQSSISIFLLGYALSQLIWGPIANRVGRRQSLIIAISIGIIGSLLCVLASPIHNYPLFLIARFITAIGSGGGLTLTFLIINDVYSYEESRRVIPFATLAFSILPGVSIFIGGLLVKAFGWESSFIFLTLYLSIALWISIRIPETSRADTLQALPFSKIFEHYLTAAKKPSLWLNASIWGLSTATIYLFSATSPLIAINQFGASPDVFGTYNLLVVAGMIAGTLATRALATKFHALTLMWGGLIILIFSSLFLLMYSHSGLLTMSSLFLIMTLFYFGLPPIFTNAAALAIQGDFDKGTASSLINFINMLFAVVTMFITTLLKTNVELILPEIFGVLVFAIGTLLSLTVLRNRSTVRQE